MGYYGWDHVDKPRRGDSRFLQVEDGETKTIRLLDDEPYTVMVHQVEQKIDGDEIFRSIQETPDPDDDYIDEHTNRFPARPRHAMRCIEINEDGEIEGHRILISGVQIFRQLKALWKKHGDVTAFDIDVTRDGEGRDTSWTISAAPESWDVDVEELRAEMDESWEFEELFPPITREEQAKIIEEAGIDLSYDPVVELLEELTQEEAEAVLLPFGQYGPDEHPPKGLTVGEVWEIDQGWIQWAADNVTSNDLVAAACRFMVQMEAVEGAGERKKVRGKKSRAKKTKARKKTKTKKKTRTKTKKKKKAIKKKAPRRKKKKEPEPEDEVDEELLTRDDWPNKSSIENYLSRWFGKDNADEEKVELALAILEAEGLGWNEDERETYSLESDEEEYEDDEVEEWEEDEEDEVEEWEEDEEDEWDRDELLAEITDIFAEDERFEETSEIVKVVKKFGGGKAKIRDLTDEQLAGLYHYLIEDE